MNNNTLKIEEEILKLSKTDILKLSKLYEDPEVTANQAQVIAIMDDPLDGRNEKTLDEDLEGLQF